MFKLAIAVALVAGLAGAGPAFADSKSGHGGIGRGCTLNPFNHTMRCIDFDHCTTDSKGNKTCPVVVTPTRVMALSADAKPAKRKTKPEDETKDYLVVTLQDAFIS
jgi:hypothetical protein